MGMRAQATADLKQIMNDKDTAFGWDIDVTDPDGASVSLVGRSQDIAQVIDPDTGQVLTGRLASVALDISDLTDAGLGIPEHIAETSSKPWIVEFLDLAGASHVFKVKESAPDRTIGLVICILETYVK